MSNQIDRKYINTIPYEIITNHIIPYTYEVKPKELLLDILTFKKDYNIIKNLYSFSYNYSILLYDLICFCNSNTYIRESVSQKIKNILMRNIVLSTYTNNKLISFVYESFHETLRHKRILPKVKFLWGLLTQSERNEFINLHIHV